MVKVRVLKNVVASSKSLTKGKVADISKEDARVLIQLKAVKDITNGEDAEEDKDNPKKMNVKDLESFAKAQEIELPEKYNKAELLKVIEDAMSDEG